MDFNTLKAYLTPSNWSIELNDGENIIAKNESAGQTFTGSVADFNSIFSQKLPDRDVNGAYKIAEGMSIPEHDKVQLGYIGADLTYVSYLKNNTVVGSLILEYTNGNLTTVTKV